LYPESGTDSSGDSAVSGAGNARLISPFKNLSVTDCNDLLAECVNGMGALEARWTGCYVNAQAYPSQLRLLEGAKFEVSKKHLAGLVLVSSLTQMDRIAGPDYQLAFDPDATQVDWGLVSQCRLRTSRALILDPSSCLRTTPAFWIWRTSRLTAYTLAESLLCSAEPETRKHWHRAFPDLLRKTGMHTADFFYRPNG
jgi:hypothetical protein